MLEVLIDELLLGRTSGAADEGVQDVRLRERVRALEKALVAIAKGERRVTPHEIRQLADLYGRKVGDFVGHRIVTQDLVPQFRTTSRHDAGGLLQSVTEQPLPLEPLLTRSYMDERKVTSSP